jgi:hypothetical protein
MVDVYKYTSSKRYNASRTKVDERIMIYKNENISTIENTGRVNDSLAILSSCILLDLLEKL